MYLFTRATIATLGRQFDAIPAAIEVGAMVTRITGRDVNVFTAAFGAPQGSVMWSARAFVKAAYGGFGDVTWITGFDTMAQIDAFDDWQMTDAGYHDIVRRAGGLYVENSGHTSLLEKLN